MSRPPRLIRERNTVSIEKGLGPALLWDRLCRRSLHGPATSLGSAGSMVAWSPWRIFCQVPLSYIRRLCLFIEFLSPSQPRKWVLFTFCDAVTKTVDMDNLKQGNLYFSHGLGGLQSLFEEDLWSSAHLMKEEEAPRERGLALSPPPPFLRSVPSAYL